MLPLADDAARRERICVDSEGKTQLGLRSMWHVRYLEVTPSAWEKLKDMALTSFLKVKPFTLLHWQLSFLFFIFIATGTDKKSDAGCIFCIQ